MKNGEPGSAREEDDLPHAAGNALGPATPATSRVGKLLLVLAIVVALAAFYFSGLRDYFAWDHLRGQVKAWQEWAKDNLLLGVLLYFVTYVIVTALSLPVASPLSLVAGALFGRGLGTAVVSAASTLGATLAFLSSRYLLRDWVQRRLGRQLAVINQGVEQDGAYYLLTLRLVPAVPFFLINLGMGLTAMRTGVYLLASWLGMLPATFLYVNAGTALAAIDKPSDVLSAEIMIALALVSIVPLVIRKLLRPGACSGRG